MFVFLVRLIENLNRFIIQRRLHWFSLLFAALGSTGLIAATDGAGLIGPEKLKRYVERFNADDEELYAHIPNGKAYEFLAANIPPFECPDKDFERTYYFRWWTFRKHIRKTPEGYVVTEFLPEVSWSQKYNTISCPAGHHFYEGRWLHNPVYLDDYAKFWLLGDGKPRQYSCWIADAVYARHLVSPDPELMIELLEPMVDNYEAWETTKLGELGLFHQIDDRDGMEVSIGGSGYRATINSYMYGDAKAISRIAGLAGRPVLKEKFEAKAVRIQSLVLSELWDPEDEFFKVVDKMTLEKADVREQHGYTPWYFNLPETGEGYEVAWGQLMDPEGFRAPYGPTTAEQRHPRFSISYEGHECQWSGPSWPLSTSVTLTALANVLNNYEQDVVSKRDYFETLQVYTRSHTLQRKNGRIVPWIDENLNPYTGDWISRTRLKRWQNGTWSEGKGGKERGKDYNHSSYNDLIITGLVGLRPRADNILEVNPLLPDGIWSYFCLEKVRYKGHELTIVWDKTGERYGRGRGLTVFVDGRKVASSPGLDRIVTRL